MINWETIDSKKLMIKFYENWLNYKKGETKNGIVVGTTRWPLFWIPGGNDVAVEFIFDEPLIKWYVDIEHRLTREKVEENFYETNLKSPLCGLFFRVIEPKKASGFIGTACGDFITEHGAIQQVVVPDDADNGKMAEHLTNAEACFLEQKPMDYGDDGKHTVACMGAPIIDGKVKIFELPREEILRILRTVKANGYKYEDLPEFDYMKEYQKDAMAILGETED